MDIGPGRIINDFIEPNRRQYEIFVINVGSYIGDSTRSEIKYAQNTGKAVRYLEEVNG